MAAEDKVIDEKAADEIRNFIFGAPEPRDDVKDILATNIARYRQKLGLSRAILAQKIGVSEPAIGQYERGTRTPQIDTICKLAAALNVPIDNLIGQEKIDYEAVTEYRFDTAINFLQRFDFLVFEDNDGRISVRKRSIKKPSFQRKHGIIVGGEAKKELFTFGIFNTRKVFITWVETLIESVLDNNDIKDMFEEALSCLADDKNYEPSVCLTYKGNKLDPDSLRRRDPNFIDEPL